MHQVTIDNSDLIALRSSLNEDRSAVVHGAANRISETIKNRIKTGIGTGGQRLVTKSASRTGSYSKGYGGKRSVAGLPTDRVTLSFRGDTADSYKVIETGLNSAVVGFDNDIAGQIAEYNENYFGNAYFASDFEKNAALNEIENNYLISI